MAKAWSCRALLCVGVMVFLGEASKLSSTRVQLEADVSPHNPKYSSWVKGARLAGSEEKMDLIVQIRVDENRLAELERVFSAVSDPQHSEYGKHRTIAQISQILNVPAGRVAIVRKFFLGAGASRASLSPHGDVLTVTMTAKQVEAALQTELYSFSHSDWPEVRIIRCGSGYSLPADVGGEVMLVGELLQFPRLPSKKLLNLASGDGAWPNDCETKTQCKGKVTPGVLVTRYNLATGTAAVPKNSMAVAEFQNQYFKTSDLESFSTACHRDVKVDVIIGGNKDTAGVEAELDIEYIRAVSPEIPLTVIYSAQYSLLNWANLIVSNSSSPYVHSVSYGNDEKQQTSVSYMFSCNTLFQKAGAQGLSILFASGDQGVWGREGTRGNVFHPDFPASSPYITAVGGTNFASTDIGEETVWNAGGGGFSDTFDIPAWQKDVVAAYKANPDAKLPPQKYWNNTGRGYPDVAALGGTKAPFCIASRGNFMGVAGTSASCPVVAGVFAKLNGIRLKAGKPVLGHLNPFIYQNPTGFQDVTSGINDQNHGHGFTAVKGWDPASGFGTPNYEALAKLV